MKINHKDKWLHALVAMGIFLVAAFASHYWLVVVAIVFVIGLLKEFYHYIYC